MVKPGSGCTEAALEPWAGVPVRPGAGLGANVAGAGDCFGFVIEIQRGHVVNFRMAVMNSKKLALPQLDLLVRQTLWCRVGVYPGHGSIALLVQACCWAFHRLKWRPEGLPGEFEIWEFRLPLL